MKKLSVLTAFVLLLSLVPVFAAQAGTTTKALQINFKVTGGYKINKVMVYGPNQYGAWTRWTPPDSTGLQKAWKNGVCDYATISVCPKSIFTANYWWTGYCLRQLPGGPLVQHVLGQRIYLLSKYPILKLVRLNHGYLRRGKGNLLSLVTTG